jgi:predicted O-methyltransferase YrrM
MSYFGQRIADMYGASVLHKSVLSIRDGGGVFERVLGSGRFKTVLEIGTYRGVSAAEMSRYCERVITIDLKHGKLERMGETWDRQEFWRSLGVENVELQLVNDDAEKAALINGLEFDFAFIDGAHDDPNVIRRDFELVKRCGTVLFHDVDSRGRPELDYVYDFVMSLPKHQVQVFDIFALWTAD